MHLITILKHKYWVFKYCHKCGITWRGIKHDMSKFSPTEFLTNAKYYKKGKSPIAIQRELFGYSVAWFHHKGHNSHHYEHWTDKYDDGCYATRMPLDDAIESLCDYMAANIVYTGEQSYIKEWEWFMQNSPRMAMHPDTKQFMSEIFRTLAMAEVNKDQETIDRVLTKENLEATYKTIIRFMDFPVQIRILQTTEILKKKDQDDLNFLTVTPK